MYRIGFGVLLAVIVTGAVYAQAGDGGPVVDPMRPPAHVPAPRKTQASEGPEWNLSAILVSPERRLAMINNRLVGVGGVVNGARVKSIYGNVVELELDGQSMLLRPGTRDVRRSSE